MTMKKVATVLSAVVGLTVLAAPAAHAGASTDAALALGSFAVLNQIVRGETVLHDLFGRGREPVRQVHVVRETVVVHQPPHVVHAPPPIAHAAPPTVLYAAPPRVVYAVPAHVRHGHPKHVRPGHHAKKDWRGHHRH
jgi:hypothetical protein